MQIIDFKNAHIKKRFEISEIITKTVKNCFEVKLRENLDLFKNKEFKIKKQNKYLVYKLLDKSLQTK